MKQVWLALSNWWNAYFFGWVGSAFGRIGGALGWFFAHGRAAVAWSARNLKPLLFSLFGFSLVIGFVISWRFDPNLTMHPASASWFWTCHNQEPSISCLGSRTNVIDDCALQPDELLDFEEASVEFLKPTKRLPLMYYDLILRSDLERAGGKLIREDNPDSIVLDITTLNIGTFSQILHEHVVDTRKVTEVKHQTDTEYVDLIYRDTNQLIALLASPQHSCEARVSYRAPWWYWEFRDDQPQAWKVRGAKFAAIIAVAAIAVVLAASVATTIMALSWAIVRGLIDLPLALLRLFPIVRAWIRIQRWPLVPIDPYPELRGTPVLFQLSDLHLTTTMLVEPEMRGLTNGFPPKATIKARMERFLQHCERAELPVLITGDITDRGLAEEWEVAREILSTFPREREVFVVLGNHDVTIGDVATPQEMRDARLERRLIADKYLRGITVVYDGLWHKRMDGFRLILLDSNLYASRQVLSNAVGRFGPRQLKDLAAFLSTVDEDIIVAGHHHIGLHTAHHRSIDDPFLVAIDGPALLDILLHYSARTRRHVLYLHGHTHGESLSVLERENARVLIYEHPSSTRAHPEQEGIHACRVSCVYHSNEGFSIERIDLPL